MNKKFLLLVFTLLSTLTASADAVKIDGIYYNFYNYPSTAIVTYGSSKYTGSIIIPETVNYNGVTYSVTSIGSSAFYNCSSLTSVTIPNSVTSISGGAFRGCQSLSSVIIGNSVTSIEYGAFSECDGLTSMTVENGNTRYDSRDNCNAIIETATNTLIAGCKNTTIPNSVTSIGRFAFTGCSGLTSITIPNSVTEIGQSAFSSCSGLIAVNIPNSVIEIGSSAFYNCSSLTSVTIPNSVTIIGESVFYACEGLTSIEIPSSVTSIGSYAFAYCSCLTSVTIPNSVTEIGRGALWNCSQLGHVYCYAENIPRTEKNVFTSSIIKYVTLHVPSTVMDDYKSTAPWSDFGAYKALPMQCATPTINYVDGKLTYDCETEGAELHYEYSFPQGSKGIGSKSKVPQTIIVSVYATKSGYENSDVATMEIEIGGGSTYKKGDVNEDGTVNGTDIQEVINIIVNAE